MRMLSVKLLIILLATQSLSFYIVVRDSPICIIISEQANKTIYFSYQVTGEYIQNFTVQFQSQTSTPYLFKMQGSQGKTKYQSQKMKVCFISTDHSSKSVSVDFYSEDSAHLAQLASKNDMHLIHNKILEVGRKIHDINQNQIFQEQRSVLHSKQINEHESNIKFVVHMKIILIIIVGITQMYFLFKILNRPRKEYEAV